MKGAMFISGLALASCAKDVHHAEPPSGVEWIAIVQLSAGEVLSSTPLTRYDPSSAIKVDADSDADAIWVLGYAGADIAVLGEVGAQPLERAYGCDAPLPAPIWTVRTPEEGKALPPALTSDWLNAECAPLQNIALDVTCAPFNCEARIDQLGCRLDLHFGEASEECGLGTVTARIHPGGGLCLEDTSSCSVGGEGELLLSCLHPRTCEVAVHLDPPPLDWRIDEFRPVPEAVPLAPSSIAGTHLHPYDRHKGWYSDFAVLEDRLAIATYDGVYRQASFCTSNAPTLVRVFSLENQSAIAAHEGPPCLTGLVPDPHTDGFLGFFGGRSEWSVGRFDREGALVSSREIPLPVLPDPHDLFGSVVVEDDGRAYAVFTSSANSNRGVYSLVSVELDTLAAAVIYGREDIATSLARADDGTLAIAESDSDVVQLFDGQTGQEVGVAGIVALTSIRLGHLAFLSGTQKFLIAVPAERPAIHLLEIDLIVEGRGWPTPGAALPFNITTWPGDDRVALVGGVTQPPHGTVLALYNQQTDRWDPRMYHAGYGAPTEMVTAGGAVYVGLAWEGRILRIRPR